jgi:NAD(P)-dependent dehydrogenase (short-subunit alcohol dehydrogenase family)
MQLVGKVAIVNGAARGVGAAIASEFANEGASVVAVDLMDEALRNTVARIRSNGRSAIAVVADVSSGEGNAAAVEAAKEQFGGVDCFVGNAAIQRFGKLGDTPPETWDQVQTVNLKGVYLGCRAAIPEMIRRGGGSLIFVASVLGIVGDGDLAAYGAAKGGLRAMCRSAAVAYGPQRIRCNTICPGDVRTEIFEDYIGRASDPAGELRRLLDLYPMRRIASPEDVARTAIFLASDDSEYITGTDLIVDGGLLAKVY